MKNVFFLLILFSFLGCLPEADISISKVSDLPNTNGQTILTLKYTAKGSSGALVADQIEVGTTVNFTPTTTGGAPTSFSITPALPTGFSFNTSDGTISGSPTGYFAPTLFLVTATNDFGSIDQNVTLGSSYGSFALLPTVDSVSSIYGNKNVALGVKVEFDVSSGVAGTYSCKIESITGDDLTTLTGISYNSTNCKIESTAIPTIYFPHHTTFVATVTRTEDLVTASSSLSIQIFNNPLISSFIIENGHGPSGVLDSRGGTISVTGVNFEVGDEFYDSTNPSNEIFLNGTSCTSLVSSTSTKCLLSEITPGTRKFKIKRATGASNEKELVVFNTAPSIEVRNPATFPTNSQKAFTYDSFPFDSTIEFIISTGPTETERNAESVVIELTKELYGAKKSFIDWNLSQCTQSNIAGGYKKLICTLKPSGDTSDRPYGLVNVKVTAYETSDPLKTTTIDGDFVRYPFNFASSPTGTAGRAIDPFTVLNFNFKISSFDHFKNLLEISGDYSPFLSVGQTNGLRDRGHIFTFDDLDFSSVDSSFTDFLDTHFDVTSSLKGKLTGDCSTNNMISAFPLSTNGKIVSWFTGFRGSITCLTFNDIDWILGSDPEIFNRGLIANSGILENENSSLSLTNSRIDFSDISVNTTGFLFGHLTLTNNLKINSGLLNYGVLNLNLRNNISGSGTWNSVGLIAGQIDGNGKIYGSFGGRIAKTGGSTTTEKFGLIAGDLSSGFGVSSERSFIRGELNLYMTNSRDNHGSVGVLAGQGSGVEVLNTQLVSTIFSSGKNLNEGGVFGSGQNVIINKVVNDVHFLKNGDVALIKGAGLIGSLTDTIYITDYNSVVLGTDYVQNTSERIKGGALFSNCNTGFVRLDNTYVVTPKNIDLPITDSNNCTFASTPDKFILIGTEKLSLLEPNPTTPIWTYKESTLFSDRVADVPTWLKNCITTPIDTTGTEKLVGFCVGEREIVPTEGAFTLASPTFFRHFSDFLAFSFNPSAVDGGYINLGASFNLEGLTNFFIANGLIENSQLILNISGNGFPLKLPEGNMPFFVRKTIQSNLTGLKLYKNSSTLINSQKWLTTFSGFYDSLGISLIFEEFMDSIFQGEINLDLNYDMSDIMWNGVSLFGYNLNNSTFQVDLKGNFLVTNTSAPASNPLLKFSGFYKGEGGSTYLINSNSLNLDLTVLTPDCADLNAGISGKWDFEVTDGAPTIQSDTYLGTSRLEVRCINDSGAGNSCLIPGIDLSSVLSCTPTRI